MDKPFSPGELYDGKTLFTLSGASMGVWLFTSVISNVLNIETEKYKWMGLLVALFLAYLGAFSIGKKWDLKLTTIAFFNGLLIFITASGIDSINHNVTVKENPAVISKSALIPFTNNNMWWAPRELTDSIKILNNLLVIKEMNLKNIEEELQLLQRSEIESSQFNHTVKDNKVTNSTEVNSKPSKGIENKKVDKPAYKVGYEIYVLNGKFGITFNSDTLLKPSYDRIIQHKIDSTIYFIVSNKGLWGALDRNLRIVVAIKQRTEGIAISVLELSETSTRKNNKKKIGVD
jgi:hypothetical protein